jgi:cytochrome P450
MRRQQGAPAVDVDPFSLEFFADPYPSHATLRDAGRVVWLARYNIARQRATKRFGRRSKLQDFLLRARRRSCRFQPARAVSTAELDPRGRPAHPHVRELSLNKALSPAVMRSLRERFTAAADEMDRGLVGKGEFDGCSELAEAYPLKVFPDAIGMRPENRHYLCLMGIWCSIPSGRRTSCFKQRQSVPRRSFLGWKRRLCVSI